MTTRYKGFSILCTKFEDNQGRTRWEYNATKGETTGSGRPFDSQEAALADATKLIDKIENKEI